MSSGSGETLGSLSVGGGHKRRALAHGYSILLNLNPFGVQNPSLDFLTPGVQPKIWVKISSRGRAIISDSFSPLPLGRADEGEESRHLSLATRHS
jgi:hypothetical protein